MRIVTREEGWIKEGRKSRSDRRKKEKKERIRKRESERRK